MSGFNTHTDPDDENYIRRRDHLLKIVKRTRWDDEDDSPKLSRGRKPKQITKPKQDLNKGRNKFFK